MSTVRPVITLVDSFEAPPISDKASFKAPDGTVYTLDRKEKRYSSWSEIVQRRAEAKTLLYLEVDSSGTVTRLLPAKIRRVESIIRNPESEDYVIRIVASPGPFRLRRKHPRFEQILEILSSFQESDRKVLLINDPKTKEIIEVRPFEVAELRASIARAIKTELTEAEADAAAALALSSNIPFDYLEDCCCSRAHAMWRLFRNRFAMQKVWNFGNGGMEGPDPTLYGGLWYFHVAPLVKVRLSDGSAIDKVIDPALFGKFAVPVGKWLVIQGDASAVHETTGPEIFRQKFGGTNQETDDHFDETDAVLADHRDELLLR